MIFHVAPLYKLALLLERKDIKQRLTSVNVTDRRCKSLEITFSEH